MTQFINTSKGAKGDKGDKGATGASIQSVAFVDNDMVFTDTDGDEVVLENAKTTLTGPQGEEGAAATVTVGSTTTGEPGTNASVTNSGSSSAVVLNFTIPRGEPGNVNVDPALDPTSVNAVQNKIVYEALDGKQDKVVTMGLWDTQGPAPDGFHVPLKDEWVSLCSILTSTLGLASNGETIRTYLKMPFVGRRDISSSDVTSQGSNGRYWSSSYYDGDRAYSLNFNSTTLEPEKNSNRAHGFSVRCFKNSPIVPDSSWTTLYDGSGIATGAGIFWNSSLGLISISGDGTIWYTIMDKNLGATTVYNSGDTISQNNCGNYYQWGNNYGFPFTGSVTTSSGLVNASVNGPGNYYSSSTFITRSSTPYRWDSTDNGNLRGGISKGEPTMATAASFCKQASAPSSPSAGLFWYDTTNSLLKVYDGTQWLTI